jgi:hypothetical protein
MRKMLIIGLCSVLFIMGIIIILLGALYKPKKVTPNKLKRMRRNRIILGVVLVILAVVSYLGYFVFYPKHIATSILEEKDTDKYSKLCDELFDATASPAIASDYLRMKAEKTIKEVQNLCGNYAKKILNKK